MPTDPGLHWLHQRTQHARKMPRPVCFLPLLGRVPAGSSISSRRDTMETHIHTYSGMVQHRNGGNIGRTRSDGSAPTAPGRRGSTSNRWILTCPRSAAPARLHSRTGATSSTGHRASSRFTWREASLGLSAERQIKRLRPPEPLDPITPSAPPPLPASRPTLAYREISGFLEAPPGS
jgi:hypothetical protein